MNNPQLIADWQQWIAANIEGPNQQKALQWALEALRRGGGTQEAVTAAYASLAAESDHNAWSAWVTQAVMGTPDQIWFTTNVALEALRSGSDSEQASALAFTYAASFEPEVESLDDSESELPTVNLVAPSEGECWEIEARQTIRWVAAPGGHEKRLAGISLELWDGDAMVETIAGGNRPLAGETQSFEWVVPGSVQPGDQYRVRVIPRTGHVQDFDLV